MRGYNFTLKNYDKKREVEWYITYKRVHYEALR